MIATGLSLKRNDVANSSVRRLGPISRASFKEGVPLSCEDASNTIRHFVSLFAFGYRMVMQVERSLLFLVWIDDFYLSPLHVVQHVGVIHLTQVFLSLASNDLNLFSAFCRLVG